jgi:phosphate transport system ATP-binding protein
MVNSQTTLLQIKNLSVSYGSNCALKNVSLNIPANGITALMGPSGCGKSTLLRAINRMHELYASVSVTGSAVLFDPQVDLLAADTPVEWVRSHIGMVFQKPNPFPKSIFENVAFGLRILGVNSKSELESRIEKSLQRAGLWNEVKERLSSSAYSLSGGQQQRLCIARALATEPKILLMDEPTSALDPISTQTIESLIMEMAQNTCIMLVTHNMQQARRVSQQTAFLYLGEILEAGSSEEIFSNPKNEITRNYIQGKLG